MTKIAVNFPGASHLHLFQTFPFFFATVTSFWWCCLLSGCSLMEMSTGSQEPDVLKAGALGPVSLLVYWRMCSCLLTQQMQQGYRMLCITNSFTQNNCDICMGNLCLVPVVLLVALG